MPAFQQGAGRLHRAEIDRLRQVPGVAQFQGMRHLSGRQPVAVDLPACIETRVKPLGNFLDAQHADSRWQIGVERAQQRVRAYRVRQPHARDLAERMHAGVGTAGAVNGYGAPFEGLQRRLDQRLNRLRAGLPLPSGIAGAVVRQGQLERPHTVTAVRAWGRPTRARRPPA